VALNPVIFDHAVVLICTDCDHTYEPTAALTEIPAGGAQ